MRFKRACIGRLLGGSGGMPPPGKLLISDLLRSCILAVKLQKLDHLLLNLAGCCV